MLSVKPSYYIYVGSAFGSGGVQARVLRHCRETKTKHWHIDYLREHIEPIGAWYRYGYQHLEHQWAQSIADMANYSAIKGFGSSDCKCYSHLFCTMIKPSVAQFSRAVGDGVESYCKPANKHRQKDAPDVPLR